MTTMQHFGKQHPTDADLAYGWGHREGYRAFLGLDVPLTAEQIFEAVQERWIEETAEAVRLSPKLSAAQRTADGVLDRLRELGQIRRDPDES